MTTEELLCLPNHHPTVPPPLTAGPDRYLGYFENRYGEQAIFVWERGQPTALLYHGDLDWQPRVVIGGRVPDTLLEPAEQLWLQACWQASAGLRQAD